MDLKEKLSNFLKNSECEIEFTKVDGTLRKGLYTLKDTIIMEHWKPKENAKAKNPNNNNLVVFDVEQNTWKTVKIENIVKFSYRDTYSDIWVDLDIEKEQNEI